ncbi:hypothetical protein Pmani_021661 [Petrolisthes manimaculis]|uniref:Uncharacterized protein n=1 Tax=Petrolisthes manimaculis TaxID=1843537 RepID=A0AAE1PG55_9EUCA|nr:hypothetical protein Pmani_037000 [Petrolisthes manimaculis]KAK4306517.1 hypothetical protein Pmani_021661 [Petrolisthes manimaculis]
MVVVGDDSLSSISPHFDPIRAKRDSPVGLLDTGERERFLATTQTTTRTVVVASTTTVPFTCVSGTDTVLCAGRRRRRKAIRKFIHISDEEEGNLLR